MAWICRVFYLSLDKKFSRSFQNFPLTLFGHILHAAPLIPSNNLLEGSLFRLYIGGKFVSSISVLFVSAQKNLPLQEAVAFQAPSLSPPTSRKTRNQTGSDQGTTGPVTRLASETTTGPGTKETTTGPETRETATGPEQGGDGLPTGEPQTDSTTTTGTGGHLTNDRTARNRNGPRGRRRTYKRASKLLLGIWDGTERILDQKNPKMRIWIPKKRFMWT